MKNIRNFCIIAHIDHGKSTLADRFLEVTGTLSSREMKHGQMLDTMDIEQERGITIKLQPVRMDWNHGGKKYQLNLIDTPGHVDFSYEVSRSLAACEGAILVVDASQGIQAQTLANCYMALENNLTIIPVLNKIDLPAAEPERRAIEIENALGISRDEIICISAKEGTNVEKVLERVIEKVPPPKIVDDDETKALIFDSVYDPYKGIVAYVRLMQGHLERGQKIKFLNTKAVTDIIEVGCFKPKYKALDGLDSGEVGYIVTGMKSVADSRVGDTIWRKEGVNVKESDGTPLPGYKRVTPFVYAGIFCTEGEDYPLLRDALEKFSLNDSALTFEPEHSGALGHGFRCGFLGLLHLDIVQERLEREYNLDLIVTAPSVSYEVLQSDGTELRISNPSELPEPNYVQEIREPWMKVEILVPKEYIGAVMKLLNERRGLSKNVQYLDEQRVNVIYEIPLASIVVDFYDELKSISSGYASMSYEFLEFRVGDLVRLDILVHHERIDALSIIIHRSEAHYHGGVVCKRLKEIIPKAQFEIPLQAAIGGKIIARETIGSFRKDVTGYLYGGDVSRKNKLLDKQKKGKKRMKMFGKVEVPQKAFLAVLKKND
ncbi:elongation factor 4 [Candidatus Peregrinibacteria bacterium RIFCSPLOWO2_01_FULL_48_20]|nr:MAG: elongation factor 4 [Candidatus Peregrinibacteria bacterium RIFCSPLOWO2_01_FULL_48_20]